MARIRIRVYFEDGAMFGPGKADLLAGIARTGSIAAAGRGMKMSYKRAWSLVATMNEMFADPLVISERGGAKGGTARLTEAGEAVLSAYRDLQLQTDHAGTPAIRQLEARLASPEARK